MTRLAARATTVARSFYRPPRLRPGPPPYWPCHRTWPHAQLTSAASVIHFRPAGFGHFWTLLDTFGQFSTGFFRSWLAWRVGRASGVCPGKIAPRLAREWPATPTQAGRPACWGRTTPAGPLPPVARLSGLAACATHVKAESYTMAGPAGRLVSDTFGHFWTLLASFRRGPFRFWPPRLNGPVFGCQPGAASPPPPAPYRRRHSPMAVVYKDNSSRGEGKGKMKKNRH